MKTIIRLLVTLLVAAFATTAFAADSAPEAAQVAAPNADKTVVDKVVESNAALKPSERFAKTGDDFLRFALTKAEKYSGKMEDALGAGVDLAVKEAPETARQWLTWRAYYHGILGGVNLLFIVGAVILTVIGARKTTDDNFNGWTVLSIVSGIIGFFSLLEFFASHPSGLDHVMSFVQIQVAPRAYVIDQLVHAIR